MSKFSFSKWIIVCLALFMAAPSMAGAGGADFVTYAEASPDTLEDGIGEILAETEATGVDGVGDGAIQVADAQGADVPADNGDDTPDEDSDADTTGDNGDDAGGEPADSGG